MFTFRRYLYFTYVCDGYLVVRQNILFYHSAILLAVFQLTLLSCRILLTLMSLYIIPFLCSLRASSPVPHIAPIEHVGIMATALLVVDMQHVFLGMITVALPHILKLCDHFTSSNLPLIFTQHGHSNANSPHPTTTGSRGNGDPMAQ